MDSLKIIFIFVVINILDCYADVSGQELLNYLMQYRRVNGRNKFPLIYNPNLFQRSVDRSPNRRSYVSEEVPESNEYDSRRMYDFHDHMRSPIIASPTMPNQLPEAEPILPGHTLLRPSLGMLKSAVKFPHKDLDDGAGVYGNTANLGITYGKTNERVLYTGFRRNNYDLDDGNNRPRLLVAFLRNGPENEEEELEKPVLRYIDYGKRERERKQRYEEEKRRKEEERLRLTLPKDPYYNSYNQNKERDVKRLLKSLTANGLTLEFFDIPRLKLEAMEQEHYHESVKPYTEFIEASRAKDLSMVSKRFPAIAKQYARETSPYYHRAIANTLTSGVKTYARR